MARSRPRLDLYPGPSVWDQLSQPHVKTEDHDLVGA